MSSLERLGRFVLARRTELDLSQMDVWQARGGPSNSTLTKLEAGTGPIPSKQTLRKLDHALRWEPGSARRALTGEGDPTPLPAAAGEGRIHIHASALGQAPGLSAVDDSLLYRRPDGLTDQEWETLVDQTRDYIEWQLNRAAKDR